MGLFSSLSNLFSFGKKRVFISYQHKYDRQYRNLLCAWDANSSFDFEFERCSPNVAIDSDQAPQIKAALTRMMKKADCLLVIVGRHTHKSGWVRWEITRAKKSDVRLKLVVVKLNNSYVTPNGLLNSGAAFARSFSRDAILKALDEA